MVNMTHNQAFYKPDNCGKEGINRYALSIVAYKWSNGDINKKAKNYVIRYKKFDITTNKYEPINKLTKW